MAKQLNVNLQMTADTSQAAQQLKTLQTQLTQLTKTAGANSGSLGLSKDIQQATTMAMKLKAQLDNATNSAGNLDLTKFNESLQKSGLKISDYQKSLSALGPEGRKVFANLASSITSAEVPLRRSNQLLSEFATSLKNTARWQISSSVLHGFMGAIQSAYGYAQDLNESLNNIRIVTGQSVDEMARFAKEANKAARELNTTTTAYTDAALIYYQQGLSDQQVKERTDVTTKLANVARESATEVSSYMTAIWNNFDKDGTQSLEHFGDVITALGAETAASTAEIAHGLEKFAAVADTIGLSYEYATSAIATIVDKTRQSEDVVGTALKTIFARIQGLSLGETLDDGTSLNKYSEALASVGISIFDNAGQLKEMDTILDEMGAKWQTLSKDQQVALAQTVAGVRQYNQLVSLMDNYDAFKGNVEIANNADGALQGQADIYAESWEAARDRVKTAAESIYQDLLDEDFFIGISNGVEHVLVSFDELIEGFGGIKGMLIPLGAIITKVFSKDIAKGIEDFAFSIKMSTEKGRKEVEDLRNQTNEALIKNVSNPKSNSGKAEIQAYTDQANLQAKMLQNAENMTGEQQQFAQLLLEQNKALGEEAIKMGQVADAVERATKAEERRVTAQVNKSINDNVPKDGSVDTSKLTSQYKETSQQLREAYKETEKLRSASMQLNGVFDKTDKEGSLERLQKVLDSLPKDVKETGDSFKNLQKAINEVGTGVQTMEDLDQALDEVFNEIEGSTAIEDATKKLREALQAAGLEAEKVDEIVNKLSESYATEAAVVQDAADANTNAANAYKTAGAELDKMSTKSYTLSEGFTALGSSIMSAFTVAQSFKALGSIWSEENDASTLDKLTSTFMTLGMTLPMITSLFSKENKEKIKSIATNLMLANTKRQVAAGTMSEAKAEAIRTGATKLSTIETLKLAAAEMVAYWPIMLIIAAVGVLIGLMFALAVAADKAAHASAEKAKAANEAVNETTTAYQEAKQAADELRESLEKYDKGIKALEELDSTTEEFKQQLEETNAEAEKLIETYGLLRSAGDYTVENGAIKISDSARAKIEQQAFSAESETYQKMLNAKIYNEGAQTEARAENMRNQYNLGYDVYTSEGTYHIQYSADEIEKLGAVVAHARANVDDADHDLDTLKQAVIDNADEFGLSTQLVSNLDSVLTNETLPSFYSLADGIDSATQAAIEYANQLIAMDVQAKYGDKIKELSTDEEGNVDQAQATQMADAVTALYTRAENEKGGIGEQVAEMTGDMYETIADNEAVYDNANNFEAAIAGMIEEQTGASNGDTWLKENYSKIFGSGTSFDGDQSIQEMLQDYAASQGWEVTNVDDNIGSTTLSYLDANGEAQEMDFSNGKVSQLWAQQIADYLAEEARKKLEEDVLDEATINSMLENLDAAGQESGSRFGADFSQGLYNSISAGDGSLDFDYLFQELSPKEHDEILAMSDEDILKLVGLDGATQEQFEAMGFANAEAFISAFKTEMEDWDVEDYTAGANAKGEADAEALGIDLDEFKTYRKLLLETNEAYEDNVEGLNQVAVANKRMEKGVKALADDWEDFNDIMSDSDSSMEDISTILPDINSALQDVLNLDSSEFELLPPTFAQDNWGLIQDVMNNVDGAVDALRDKAGEEILLNVTGALDTTELDAELLELNNSIASMDASKFEVGIALNQEDQAKFYANCEALVNKAGMSAAQAEAYFASMGYDVEVEEKPVNSTTQAEYSYYKLDPEATEKAGGVPQFSDSPTTITVDRTESATALAIKSITPNGSYGGGIGVNTSAPKSSTAKANNSGKGGKTKEPQKKQTKKASDEVERYHEVNDAIDDLDESMKDLNREFEKLSTRTDRAFGASKIKLMRQQREELRKQVDVIDDQIEAQKRLLAEEKKYLQQDKSEAQSYGWTFDGNGNVQNYESTLQKIVDEYNAVILAYNAMDAAAQEAYMKAKDEEGRDPLQQAEDRYNKAIEALNKYEETREKIEDTENDIADKEKERLEKLQEEYDLLLAEVQTEIELKVSVDDSALDLLKDKLADLGDSADNALDVIANINEQVDRTVSKSETYREGIHDTLNTLKGYGVSDDNLKKLNDAVADGSISNMKPEDLQGMFSGSEIVDYATLIGDLQDYSKELLSMNEEIRAYKDQVFDTMSAAFNEYLEDLERYEAKTEHAKKLTQGYKDLITSLGKANIDKDGSLTKQINEALVSESKDALREAQATQDYAQSAFDKAKAEYEKYSTQGSPWYNEEMARKWKAQMEECEDALMAAEEKTQEALQATAEAIKTAFKDTIAQIMDDLDDSLGSVSHLQQQFDQAQELSEQYLDDYKKIYELSKLTRQVNKTMDETNNVKAKKMLMEYQAKINKYQQDGVKMSQYELEHLQKEYELRLAQIQLEEVQNAKSQVRMTRDSEGNYGYVYTADDSAQSDAQQNYEDKLYALQELNTQYITEMQRLSLEIQAQWQETLNQILEDDSLSLAEQQARIAEASDFYTQRLAYVNEQLGIAVGNNRTLYEEDWTKYSEVTGYKISADEDYVDTWGETTLAVLTGAHDQQGYYQSVQLAFSTAVASIQQETAKYQEALNAVGLSADALAGKISADVEVQKQASNEAALAAEDMSQRAQGAMEEIMNKAGEFSERWVTELEATITKNQEYVQSILDMITALSDLDAAANTPKPSNPPVDPGDGGGGGGGNGGGGGGGTPNNADKIEGVAAAIWMDGGGTSGWYNGNDRVSRLQEKGVTAAQAYIDQHGPNGDIYATWHNKRAQLKSFYYGSFDTGGYTGDWGDSEGRLALLHSKELVLNAQDTENMLAIIDMVRQISSAIDTNALSTLMSSGLTAASVNAKGNDVLEQHVTITAEFPNATDKDSILDAFDNVINLAAQYANRR